MENKRIRIRGELARYILEAVLHIGGYDEIDMTLINNREKEQQLIQNILQYQEALQKEVENNDND